jgi:hypothetical protein
MPFNLIYDSVIYSFIFSTILDMDLNFETKNLMHSEKKLNLS